MKLYISADIEGVAGISHWDEAAKTKPEYQEFRRQMTQEVLAACDGAMDAGASEILIKDAHGSGRNILAGELPDCAKLIRGWSGHPLDMVQELDASFAAVLMIGYHSKASSEDNPLAHTLSLKVAHIKINDVIASEFLLHAYAAALFDVPVVFLSGDKGICRDVNGVNPNIATVTVSEGIGASTLSIAPRLAVRNIREGVAAALGKNLSACKLALAKTWTMEIKYQDPVNAYRASHYPGAQHIGAQTVQYHSDDYLDLLRMLKFTV